MFSKNIWSNITVCERMFFYWIVVILPHIIIIIKSCWQYWVLWLPFSLSLSIPIIHLFGQNLLAASCVYAELMYVNLCRSANTSTSVRRSPLENIAYEFVLASPAVPHMSCLSYLNGSWMVCEMGGRWPYNCCYVGCYFQDLLKIKCRILV